MNLKLLGWSSEGLRCPDIEVRLDEGKKITLFQMPNGTGKTTTLDLLRASMNGSASKWSADEVRKFCRAGKGTFALHLIVDGSPLTFEMQFDSTSGTVSYRTSRPQRGGVENGYYPPPEIRRFFSDQFVELFFFDGERAGLLLDNKQTRADQSVYAMCHLYLFEDMQRELDSHWNRVTNVNVGGVTQQGLTRAKNDLSKLKEKERTLVGTLKAQKKILKEAQDQIGVLRGEFDKLNANHEEIKQKMEASEKKATEQRGRIELLCVDLMSEFRSPFGLHNGFKKSLQHLKENLDVLKLPEATSNEFFVELSECEACICDRPIGKIEKAAILRNASKFLGNETAGILNALKTEIADRSSSESGVAKIVVSLGEALRLEKGAATEVDVSRQQLTELGGERAKEIERDLDAQQKKADGAQEIIDSIEIDPADPDADEFCLKSVKIQIKEKEITIASITNTLAEKKRCDLLKTIFDRSIELSKEKLKKELVSATNTRLKKYIPDDDIQLESIDNCLTLAEDRDGASVGQTLSIGYCFITALLERGNHEFPLIVDSPVGSLDDKRRNETAQILPKVCSQFVSFIINTELPDFVENLDHAANGKIQYLTAFRRGPGSSELEKNLPRSGVTQTPNGILVEGKQYFSQFKLTKME